MPTPAPLGGRSAIQPQDHQSPEHTPQVNFRADRAVSSSSRRAMVYPCRTAKRKKKGRAAPPAPSPRVQRDFRYSSADLGTGPRPEPLKSDGADFWYNEEGSLAQRISRDSHLTTKNNSMRSAVAGENGYKWTPRVIQCACPSCSHCENVSYTRTLTPVSSTRYLVKSRASSTRKNVSQPTVRTAGPGVLTS